MLQTLPKILESYVDSGKVRYVLKDFPLPSHANAEKAAEAARCAGAQAAFWPMHSQLFNAQKQWASQEPEQALDVFVEYAKELALDPIVFRDCLESGQFGPQVREDQWAGQQAGVRGTPSFLINGQLIAGAYPFETFQELIEAELEKLP